MSAEGLHVKTGQRVSYRIENAGNMTCRHIEVVLCSNEEKVTEEVHGVWAVGSAGVDAVNYRSVVTVEADSQGGPVLPPCSSSQGDGVQLLVLD